MGAAEVYNMDFKPKVLKQLMLECGITQADLVEVTGYQRPSINLAVNRGDYLPALDPDGFRAKVEEYLAGHDKARDWLVRQGLDMRDIWTVADERPDYRKALPAGTGARIRAGQDAAKRAARVTEEEAEMQAEKLTEETRKHFKLFRDPFTSDVRSLDDVFMSREHQGVLADMLDTAHHGGFLAVVGEVGSGKSVMRKALVEQLRKDGDILVIYPQSIDKARLTATAICDAIIQDVSNEKPKVKLEDKTRQVTRLLIDRSQGNYRCVLIIEEAHDLGVATLKYLKRFYELEDGFKKLLGIILIGQTELRTDKLNEGTGYGMREVIRRCQVREIPALNGDSARYIEQKFARVNADYKAVFDNKALDAMKDRLSRKGRGGELVSHAYPLSINNYCVRAMNRAASLGAPVVSADIVYNL